MGESHNKSGGVFISWTRSDTNRDGDIGKLIEALKALNVPYWIDDEQIGDFDSISEKVREGLSSSKVLLAWYSCAYPTRKACREEITLALLAADNVKEISKRVLLLNPEENSNHILEAPLLDSRFANKDSLRNIDELAEQIAERVSKLEHSFGELPTFNLPRWRTGIKWNGGSERFVGRLSELWKIHKYLHTDTEIAGTGRAGRSIAIVSGPGGIGKSLLASEYAHLFSHEYPGGVFWLSAFGNDTSGKQVDKATEDTAYSQNQIIAIGLNINPSGMDDELLRAQIANRLEREGKDVLWIVDDLPSGLSSEQLAPWRCGASVVHEIITTRDSSHSSLPTVQLDVLSLADAASLLLKSHDRISESSAREDAEKVASILGCHPLACDVAGLYMFRLNTTFTEYAELIENNLSKFDELAQAFQDQLPGGHSREIAATIGTSLKSLDKSAWAVLRLASQLAQAPIPRTLLKETLHLSSSKSSFEEGIFGVQRDGLMDWDNSGLLVVHVLTAMAALILDPEPKLIPTAKNALISVLLSRFQECVSDVQRHGELLYLVPHARYITSEISDNNAANLLNYVAKLDLERGQLTIAIDQFEKLVEWDERILGPDHPDTLTSKNNLAVAYKKFGGLPKAIELLKETLADSERILGSDHPNTFSSKNNLAVAYKESGDLEKAIELFEKTLADRERILGSDHPNTLTSKNNLAMAYQESGDLQKAIELFEKTLADSERILGPDHPNTFSSKNNLAVAYKESGDLEKAIELLKETLADRERILGSDHPDTLTSKNNLAMTYQESGDLEKAIELLKETLADRERILGSDHPDTLSSKNNLAVAYKESGDLEKAIELLKETLADRERILGSDHPDTLTSKNNLAMAYQESGDLEKAIELFEKTLADSERILGSDHPNTFSSKNNLAVAYKESGDLPKAIELLKENLADRERILGSDHPKTLSSKNNLAMTYQESGDLQKAIELLKET